MTELAGLLFIAFVWQSVKKFWWKHQARIERRKFELQKEIAEAHKIKSAEYEHQARHWEAHYRLASGSYPGDVLDAEVIEER